MSDSLRKKCDKMAEMTTLRAPMGVTRMASVNAYATKLRISPMTIIIIPGKVSFRVRVMASLAIIRLVGSPVHHIQFFRYACPSPVLLPYLRVALSRPFFFTTKLLVSCQSLLMRRNAETVPPRSASTPPRSASTPPPPLPPSPS